MNGKGVNDCFIMMLAPDACAWFIKWWLRH